MGSIDHAPGDGDIGLKILVAGIDHHRAVEARLDTVHGCFFIAMVKMHSKDGFREDLVCAADQTFQQHLVGVRASALADLDDKRRLRAQVAAEQPHGLLQVVDIVGANGILAIRGFK